MKAWIEHSLFWCTFLNSSYQQHELSCLHVLAEYQCSILQSVVQTYMRRELWLERGSSVGLHRHYP
jgi:hypothetical protein